MHCLILADAARARFLTADELVDGLVEVVDLVQPAAHMRSGELYSDGQGRRGNAALEPHTMPRDIQDKAFAHRIADMALERIDDYERLIVVAPPSFLGELRRALPARVSAKVVASIDKDFSSLALHDIGPAVRRHLPPTAGME